MVIWVILAGFFMLLSIVLFVKIRVMRMSLNEITEELQEILPEDTNSLITVTTSDSYVCRLAEKLNEQLRSLRKEQLRLRNGNHELQNAVTNIAHDLRTPLTAISGYLELLEQENTEGKPKEYLEVICERTENLKNLTEELFRYSVIDDTIDELRFQTVALNDELEIALAAAYQTLSDHGIKPKIQIPEQTVIRELDKDALQRIFSNVLNNAAKYSSGDLSVSLEPDGTIRISNSAPSLSEIDVGKLFDRFYTVENAKGSTGLGLSIAKLLTEKMGGTINADYVNGIFLITVFFNEKQGEN